MQSKKFSAKRIAVMGMMAALLIAGKYVLSFIPNVEVVTTLILCYACVFGFDSVIATLIFCTADILIYPPALDVIVSYYIYWDGLAITASILSELRIKKFVPYLIVGVIGTLSFGLITSLMNSLFYGVNFTAVYLAGILFYAIQLVSTVVFMSVGFKPITNLLTKMKQRII